MSYFKGWGQSMPVYVTRRGADGVIGTLSASIGMVLIAFLLVWLNVMVWSVVGLVAAVKVVV